jgi:hypothetical protein
MRITRLGISFAAISFAAIGAMVIPLSTAQSQGKAKNTADPAAKAALTPEEKAAADLAKALKRGKVSEAFFAASNPLEMTLTTNIKRIRGDKGANAPWRPATFTYNDASGKPVVIPAQVRTRGIWRLKNCEFPPLRINFKSEVTKETLFKGVDKPKLVSYCRDTDDYEQYLLQELQIYRIYNLLTPASHRVRLLQLSYVDSASGKLHTKRSAILLEEPEVMAARAGGPIVDQKGAIAEDLDPFHDALVGVFQYFIGNTDFSIYALHNVELVNTAAGTIIPVAYDFDFSGAINTTYATTDPKLAIQKVRSRLFRGYCQPVEEYEPVYAKFKEQKDAIYGLYADSIGKLMKPKLVEQTLKYYDEFYKTISDSKRAKKEISDDCVKTN